MEEPIVPVLYLCLQFSLDKALSVIAVRPQSLEALPKAIEEKSQAEESENISEYFMVVQHLFLEQKQSVKKCPGYVKPGLQHPEPNCSRFVV